MEILKRNELSSFIFERMGMVEPYPEKVIPVSKMLNVTAFFPGGRGLWLEDNATMFPDVLVIGQDFSTVNEYNKMLHNNQNEINSPTWFGLRKLFANANIDLNRCFFSNVYMGLRESTSMTGPFPGGRDKTFVERNQEFLRFQLKTIKPKLIISLGRPASINLGRLSLQLREDWSNGKALSQPDNGLKQSIKIDGKEYICVALEHTSMRNSNVKRRVYSKQTIVHTGNDAEVEMLKDAMKFAFAG